MRLVELIAEEVQAERSRPQSARSDQERLSDALNQEEAMVLDADPDVARDDVHVRNTAEVFVRKSQQSGAN